jgi:proteasome lid subunit RPN8/RPN11
MQDEVVLNGSEERSPSTEGVVIPVNFAQAGEVREDDVRIYITTRIVDQIDSFAAQDLTRERGGVLVGKYSEQMGKRYLIVEGILEAKHTDSTSTTLTFTHETWDTLHAEKERDFAGTRILGWFHTHPRFGIFLSSYDLFIQQNYFNIPWQIAYVVDPVAKTRGFYIWRGGEIVRCEGFYLYDEPGKQVYVPKRLLKSTAVGKKPVSTETSMSGKVKALMLLPVVLLVVVSIFLGLQVASLQKHIALLQGEVTTSEKNSADQKVLLDAIATRVDAVESALTPAPTLTPEPIPTEAVVDTDPLKDGYRLFPYTIQEGDTLSEICGRNNLSMSSEAIAAMNGIQDPNQIHVGQIILVPGTKEIA